MKLLKIVLLLIPALIFSQKGNLNQEISKITDGKNATVGVSVLGIDFPFTKYEYLKRLLRISGIL